MKLINFAGDAGLSRSGAAFGIEALLAIAMGAMMMGMMGQQQQQPDATPPEPTKPQPMPDPNAKAMQEAADAEKRMLLTSTDGRQGTNLSKSSKALGSTAAPAPAAGGSDYSQDKLG